MCAPNTRKHRRSWIWHWRDLLPRLLSAPRSWICANSELPLWKLLPLSFTPKKWTAKLLTVVLLSLFVLASTMSSATAVLSTIPTLNLLWVINAGYYTIHLRCFRFDPVHAGPLFPYLIAYKRVTSLLDSQLPFAEDSGRRSETDLQIIKDRKIKEEKTIPLVLLFRWNEPRSHHPYLGRSRCLLGVIFSWCAFAIRRFSDYTQHVAFRSELILAMHPTKTLCLHGCLAHVRRNGRHIFIRDYFLSIMTQWSTNSESHPSIICLSLYNYTELMCTWLRNAWNDWYNSHL